MPPRTGKPFLEAGSTIVDREERGYLYSIEQSAEDSQIVALQQIHRRAANKRPIVGIQSVVSLPRLWGRPWGRGFATTTTMPRSRSSNGQRDARCLDLHARKL